MATADSVKAKLQGLIDAANAKTGGSDADLSTAVDTLIAGFGAGGGGGGDEYLAMLNGDNIPSKGGTLAIPDGVTRIPQYFYDTVLSRIESLTVTIPDSVKSIEKYAFGNVGNMYAGRYTTFKFNRTVEEIGIYAFNGSRYCTYENIPESIKSIGDRAFKSGCTATSPYSADLIFPNLEVISVDAFQDFNFSGANVYIGNKITAIGVRAFSFQNSPTFTLTIDRAEDAISGAPWGATNATIIWTGDS